MRELVDESVMLSEAKLMIEDFHYVYIFVEGESDRKFFNTFWNVEHLVFFRQISGWENVVRVIKKANSEKSRHIVGVIDKDFHYLLNDKVLEMPNLLCTDDNDIEMMLFNSPSFDKFISICASENKIKAINKPREAVMEPVNYIGALRLVSLTESIGLDFDEIEYKDFINRRTLSINIDMLIAKICQRTCSRGKTISLKQSDIRSKMYEMISEHGQQQLCVGHDILEVISLAMCKLFATKNANTYCADDIFCYLMMGYTQQDFESSNLYQSYKLWSEKDNNIT